MDELNVRIINLPPLRVASVHAYSTSPEHDAWTRLVDWAGPRGLLKDLQTHRIFGFNNPNPSPGSPQYGYEFWIVVGPEIEGGDGATIKDFPGGLYAVTRCEVMGDGERITQTWQQLVKWGQKSTYEHDPSHQWLEEHLSEVTPGIENLVMNLYMPVAIK